MSKRSRSRNGTDSPDAVLLDTALSLRCLNCDDAMQAIPPARLFCCELCRQTAAAIRYGRAIYADGRIDRDDVAEAWTIRWAWVTNGKPYPVRERKVSPPIRAAVFSRTDGQCQSCGGVATDIDHLNNPDFALHPNHPDNLQALCAECHRQKSLDSLEEVPFSELSTETQNRIIQLTRRLESRDPLRMCDDDAGWPGIWRSILSERRKYLQAIDGEEDEDWRLYDVDELRSYEY